MPLSANLLKLESSILTRAKRATNLNNVATEKLSYIFFFGGILVGGILSGGFYPGTPLEHRSLSHLETDHLSVAKWERPLICISDLSHLCRSPPIKSDQKIEILKNVFQEEIIEETKFKKTTPFFYSYLI